MAWLFDEASAPAVIAELRRADTVVTSDLTVLECERGLVRAVTLSAIGETLALELRSAFLRTIGSWQRMPISHEVLVRARQPFPNEPIRSLDAIHLATALLAREAIGELGVLSLDRRVRSSAERLGLDVLPT